MPLGKRNDCGDAKYAGLEVAFSSELVGTLEVRGGGAAGPTVLRLVASG